MKDFIEIVANKKRRLLNIRYIEEVAEHDDSCCFIYLAHNCPDAVSQDYYLVDKPYEVIKMLIKGKEGAE